MNSKDNLPFGPHSAVNTVDARFVYSEYTQSTDYPVRIWHTQTKKNRALK